VAGVVASIVAVAFSGDRFSTVGENLYFSYLLINNREINNRIIKIQ